MNAQGNNLYTSMNHQISACDIRFRDGNVATYYFDPTFDLGKPKPNYFCLNEYELHIDHSLAIPGRMKNVGPSLQAGIRPIINRTFTNTPIKNEFENDEIVFENPEWGGLDRVEEAKLRMAALYNNREVDRQRYNYYLRGGKKELDKFDSRLSPQVYKFDESGKVVEVDKGMERG